MQYVMLIYEKPGSLQSLTDAERQQVAADYYALNSDPRVTAGLWMKPVDMATAVRVQGSTPLVTDGPFADSKEVIGGYFVLQADTIDQAIEIAARIPQARLGGGVEIRPTVEQPG
jgi:hypothetical protein